MRQGGIKRKAALERLFDRWWGNPGAFKLTTLSRVNTMCASDLLETLLCDCLSDVEKRFPMSNKSHVRQDKPNGMYLFVDFCDRMDRNFLYSPHNSRVCIQAIQLSQNLLKRYIYHLVLDLRRAQTFAWWAALLTRWLRNVLSWDYGMLYGQMPQVDEKV